MIGKKLMEMYLINHLRRDNVIKIIIRNKKKS